MIAITSIETDTAVNAATGTSTGNDVNASSGAISAGHYLAW